MKQSLLLLSLVAVTSFLVPSMTASAQSVTYHHCTASNPCVDICGDHVCAPGELAQMTTKSTQATTSNTTTSSTPSNYTASTSTGIIVGGVVSYMDVASDGTAVVVRTGHPLSGQPLSIGIAFKDASESFVQHQNYAITVTQDDNVVFSNPAGHTHSGTDSITTNALSSNNPVDIRVTLLGVGLPTSDPSTWTGIKGEVLNFSQVLDVQLPSPAVPATNMTNATSALENSTVPEFGSIAGVIISISVIGCIMISRRFGKF